MSAHRLLCSPSPVMHGVRRALGALAAGVAGCRGVDLDPPMPPAPVAEADATPTIGISAHDVAPPRATGVAASLPAPPLAGAPPRVIAAVAPVLALAAPAPDEREPPLLVPRAQVRAELEPLGDGRDGLEELEVPREPSQATRHPYGLAFDLGVPDGATVALVLHPVRSLAVSAGVSYNGISYGGRGGVTWTPLEGTVSPTLSADVGHFAEGDANRLAQLVTGNPMYSSPLLDRIGYDYANAQVGLAVSRHSFTFFARAGVSRLTGALHGLADLAGGKMLTFGSDPTVTLTTVSARVGVIYYLAK